MANLPPQYYAKYPHLFPDPQRAFDKHQRELELEHLQRMRQQAQSALDERKRKLLLVTEI